MEKFLSGDQILADRGFTIEESVGLYCAEGREIDLTRKLAHVHIHVERVIGQLKKKYTILQSVIPITLLNKENSCTIDNIVTTCCSLCNLSESVVPFD